MYIPGGTLHIPFRQHVRRKNKNMPLALLDQSVHRCVHLWGRLHCGPDDQQILRPEKTFVLQGGIVVHGRHRTIHARSDRRQSLRPGRPPHRRASGRACQGAVSPSLVILSVVASWYEAFSSSTAVEAVLRGMQAGVAALIVDIVVDMWRMILRKKSALLNAMVPGAFVASFVFHLHIAVILAVCCILSLWHVRIKQERRSG